MDTSALLRTLSFSLRLVASAFCPAFRDDYPKKNDNLSGLGLFLSGMNGKPACEGGRMGSRGAQVGYRAAF